MFGRQQPPQRERQIDCGSVCEEHPVAYRDGRVACSAGIANSENPHERGDRRVAWFTGWYDQHFGKKWGATKHGHSPWPEPI